MRLLRETGPTRHRAPRGSTAPDEKARVFRAHSMALCVHRQYAMHRIALIALFTPCLFPQSDTKTFSITGGFKAGAPLNDPPGGNTLFSSYNQGRWTGGPTVEFHLPFQFSVEFDALFHSNRSGNSFSFPPGPNVNSYTVSSFQKTNAWDTPLLLKRVFQVGPIKPFLSGGYYWSRESRENSFSYACSGPQGSCLPSGYPAPEPSSGFNRYSQTVSGLVGGAGLEFKTRHVTISPELRYNRVKHGANNDGRFTGLVGFTFGRK